MKRIYAVYDGFHKEFFDCTQNEVVIKDLIVSNNNAKVFKFVDEETVIAVIKQALKEDDAKLLLGFLSVLEDRVKDFEFEFEVEEV